MKQIINYENRFITAGERFMKSKTDENLQILRDAYKAMKENQKHEEDIRQKWKRPIDSLAEYLSKF